MTEDLYRIQRGSTRDRARPEVISVAEQAGQEFEEAVFARIHVARRIRRAECRAAVPVPTPIARPTVHPVRIHPTTAHATRHQPGHDVTPGLATRRNVEERTGAPDAERAAGPHRAVSSSNSR